MNILFYVTCTPNPQNGGIERVSHILASEFNKMGYTCYCFYLNEVEDNYISDVYKECILFDYKDVNALQKVVHFIINKQIEIVVNQQAYTWPINNLFYEALKIIRFHFIAVHHNNPIPTLQMLKDRFSRSKLKRFIFLYFPNLMIFILNYLNRKQLNCDAINSDKYVFLSPSYISNIFNIYRVKTSTKFVSIPNPLSFSYIYDMKQYDTKKKNVLIVARFQENQKKIVRAINIWKELESSGYNDWNLLIIGHGKDKIIYENLIQNSNVKNITIHDKCNPTSFYLSSSIFLMTSSYEGWGMTLVEAQQFGCVPIVYDTYSAVHDIIENGNNGYIIKDGDKESFKYKLLHLMNNYSVRFSMAANAVKSCQRFDSKKIASQWDILFKEVAKNKIK